MSVVRGASAATGEMVLCTGTGPVVLYMDASGKPTSAPHFCPECLQALTSAVLPDADLVVSREVLAAEHHSAAGVEWDDALPNGWHDARAPPRHV